MSGHPSLIGQTTIEIRSQLMARELYSRSKDQRVILVPIMEGAKPFVTMLAWELTKLHRNVSIAPVQAKSYEGTKSTGKVDLVISEQCDDEIESIMSWAHHNIVIVDDVFETGKTIDAVVRKLCDDYDVPPGAIEVLTLLRKEHTPHRWQEDRTVRSVGIDQCSIPIRSGFIIDPSIFVVGFGMDYNGQLRTLPYIGEYQP